MKQYIDERYPEQIITENMLRLEWETEHQDECTFSEYIRNCTDKNGTLAETQNRRERT